MNRLYLYYKLPITILFLLVTNYGFSQENDIYENIDQKVISKIINPANNLNIRYSDFLIIIPDYSLIGVNFDNYYEYNEELFPLVDHNIDYNIHILDREQYYFVPTSDTLAIYEDITTESIFEKPIQIVPLQENPNIKYKISIALIESIQQQYIIEKESYDTHPELDLERWEGLRPYKLLKRVSEHEFLVPKVSKLENLKSLKHELSLTDTYVLYEGEVTKEATMIYKGRPSVFTVEGAILKIEKYDNKNPLETYYIRISFSYGC